MVARLSRTPAAASQRLSPRIKAHIPPMPLAAPQMRVLLFVGVLAAPAGAVQKVLGTSLTEPSAFSSLEITANSTGACSGPNCGCPHACSGHGSCSNGVCQCFPGFTGDACQRLACPTSVVGEECSGHGTCQSMKVMATMTNALPLSPVTTYTGASGTTTWDEEMAYGWCAFAHQHHRCCCCCRRRRCRRHHHRTRSPYCPRSPCVTPVRACAFLHLLLRPL